jgi:hypothetical protein
LSTISLSGGSISQRHDIAEPAGVPGGAKSGAAMPDMPFVRSREAFPDDGAFALAVRRPQRGDGLAASASVAFVPRRDIAIGERLSIKHGASPMSLSGPR